MAAVNNAVYTSLVDEAFRSVEKMLWKIVYHWHKKHGGDEEDLFSIAKVGFMRALNTWDESKGAKFSTHVWNYVFYTLKDEAAYLHKQAGFLKERVGPSSNEEKLLLEEDQSTNLDKIETKNGFDLRAFFGALSTEAQELAKVALQLGSENRPVSENILAEIFQEAGWAASEFIRAFSEIREVLS